MELDLHRIREICRLAREVGGFLLKERGKAGRDLAFSNKSDTGIVDPVTSLDLRSSNLLKAGLSQILPVPFVSEEEPEGEGGEIYWLVDPLDGTNNFINDLPFYALSIALVEGKEPILGVVYAPALHQLYWGAKGWGAYQGRRRLQVSPRLSPFWIAELATQPTTPEELGIVAPLIGRIRAFRIFGAMALSLVYTASQKTDLFLGAGYPWDIAAGMVILKEAGGVFKTLDGKDRHLEEKVWSIGGAPEVVAEVLQMNR